MQIEVTFNSLLLWTFVGHTFHIRISSSKMRIDDRTEIEREWKRREQSLNCKHLLSLGLNIYFTAQIQGKTRQTIN